MKIRVVGDEHSCGYCQDREGMEIKEDIDMPPFPGATEEMPDEGCGAECGCRCAAVRGEQ